MVILSTPLFWLLRDHVLSPTVRPPRPLCCLLWLCSYLSCFWSMPNTPSQVRLCGYLIHPWSTPTTPSHPSASCGYLTYPWRMPTMHALLPAVATWLLTNPWSRHSTPSQVWLSHPSLEYAHHAHLSASASCSYVAISFIPGVRTPRLARCGYLTHPWSTPTSLPLPAVATWLSRLSLEYVHHAQPGVAMWLSHPSMEYVHHAHLSASCGYVAISLIHGVHPPRPPLCLCQLWLSHPSLEYAHHAHLSASCGYVTISLIPGVRTPRPARCGYLTHPWSTPTTPTSLPLPAVAISLISPDHAHHTHLSASCGYVASHQSLEYAHHAQPGVPISPIPGVFPPRPPSASCGYVAISLIPGAYPTHPLFYQLWLCGYATNPWSTPNAPSQVWLCGYLPYPLSTPAAPTLCQRWLRSYLIYPWSTPILLPAAATRLRTWPWNTPTTPSQPQVWWLCGHLTLHQLGFSG